MERTTDLKSTR